MAAAIWVLMSMMWVTSWVICSSSSPAMQACSELLLPCSRQVAIMPTMLPVCFCSELMMPAISWVDFWVRMARLRTSSATTAKPRP